MQRAEDEHPERAVVARQALHRLWRSGVVLLVVFLAVVAGLALGGYQHLSLETLLRDRATIAALVAGHPAAALASFIAVYALACAVALPGVVFLTIGGGVFFGGFVGGMAAVSGATAGAVAMFLAARLALRDLVMRWLGLQVARFAKGFRASGFNYLLFIRLVPIFPFSLGNLLPALCDVRLVTFAAATFIGITPMTLAIAFFGASIDRALGSEIAQYHACQAAGGGACTIEFHIWMVVTPQLIGALVALGAAALLPVAIKRWLADRRAS